MKTIYIEDIIQSFVSNGNVFLLMSSPSGEVDTQGNDVGAPPVSLVIPLSKFGDFVKNVKSAGEQYVLNENKLENNKSDDGSKKYLGKPLVIY